MDNDRISGKWKQFKGRVRETWGDLTDDDVDTYRGKVEQLAGRIQEKTGEAKDKIRERLRKISDEL